MNRRALEPSPVKLPTCPFLTSAEDLPSSHINDNEQTRGANVPVVLDSFLPARPNNCHVLVWYTFYTVTSRSQLSTLPVIPSNHLSIVLCTITHHSLHVQSQSLQGFPPRRSPSRQPYCPEFQTEICIQAKNFVIRVWIIRYLIPFRTNCSIRHQLSLSFYDGTALFLQMLSLLPSQNIPSMPSPFPSYMRPLRTNCRIRNQLPSFSEGSALILQMSPLLSCHNISKPSLFPSYSSPLRTTNCSLRNQLPSFSDGSTLLLQMSSLLPSQNMQTPRHFPSMRQSSTGSLLPTVPSQQQYPFREQCPFMEQFFPHFSHPPFPWHRTSET